MSRKAEKSLGEGMDRWKRGGEKRTKRGRGIERRGEKKRKR